MAFLVFAPEHAELGRAIAIEAAERAGEVGSGRVGRTRKLSLDEPLPWRPGPWCATGTPTTKNASSPRLGR